MRITKGIFACCCVQKAWVYACHNCSLAIASTGRVEYVFQNFGQCAVAEWNILLLWPFLQRSRHIGLCYTSDTIFQCRETFVNLASLLHAVGTMIEDVSCRFRSCEVDQVQDSICQRPWGQVHHSDTANWMRAWRSVVLLCAGCLSETCCLFNQWKELRRAVNGMLFDPNQLSIAKRVFKDRERRTRV